MITIQNDAHHIVFLQGHAKEFLYIMIDVEKSFALMLRYTKRNKIYMYRVQNVY